MTEIDESEVQWITIRVNVNWSGEQVLEEFQSKRAPVIENKRQRTIWNARSIVSGCLRYPGYEQKSEPSIFELKRELEALAPKKIEERIKRYETELKLFRSFEKNLFEPALWERKPMNWQYEAATKEEYVALKKEANKDQLDTVNKAIPYLEEILKVHRAVLRQKLAFVKESEPKVPGLVQKCTRLTKEANDVRRQVLERIQKLERCKEKDKPKIGDEIIHLIMKHRQLESEDGAARNKLAEYTPDRRDIVSGLPAFPWSRYNLPLWLQVKLEREVRG